LNLLSARIEEIKTFIEEDLGAGDVTAQIIPATTLATADVITREAMVICGQAWFESVFNYLNPLVNINWLVREGENVDADHPICTLHGPARPLLTGERTALNLLQTLSATATISRRYAEAVAGTGCKILDTRKTIPGLRQAQKYAVRCGGCYNHRMGLYDAILIKENHIIAAGSLTNAVTVARSLSNVPIEVEVESIQELQEALSATPDRIMLDNFTLADIAEAVKLAAGQVELEASGNIDLNNCRRYAETGVDYISIGALTKNIRAVDLSMRIQVLTE
jgi:nicotinate-nucleotide pyrophosphorylase (carboxylating)